VLAAGAGLAASVVAGTPAARAQSDEPFRISLAQWSLHRAIRAGELDPLDFPGFARERFGLEAVEYVSQLFPDEAGDFEWLGELRRRADDRGVRSLLIMIDEEGVLGDADEGVRRRAVERHFKWLPAARFLGCHSIRVNAAGTGPAGEVQRRVAESLHRLAVMGEDYGLDVIVENHGGHSSNGAWLAETIRMADHPAVGTLPDFGNFTGSDGETYDRYRGVKELMPFARAVSAKSYSFDEDGEERTIDFHRMLRIVHGAGYRGHVGIEFEGEDLGEPEGIRRTLALLERVRAELA